jgi:hypothetical protein
MKQRAVVAAVLGGLVAIIAVPLLIFAYGRHDPSPPSLEDDPVMAIPGTVLFFDEDGCVVEVAASGAQGSILTCDVPTVGELLTRLTASHRCGAEPSRTGVRLTSQL